MAATRNWADNPVTATLVGLVLLCVAVYLSVATFNKVKEGRYIGPSQSSRNTITIDGEGKVTAVPDIGQITVSIVTDDKDVSKGQVKNTTQSNKLIADLQAAGVDKKDMTTSNYSVYPQYDYTDGKSVLKGYEITQSLTVKIRDIANSGKIVTIATENGANQVSGLTFTIDEPESLRQQAREKAMQNALDKAKALAKVAGVKLGKIVSFSESNYSNNPGPIFYAKEADSRGGLQSAPAPDFQQGSQDVIVDATVQFEVY